MKKKHQIINDLIKEHGFKSYLEIGYNYGHNFRLIECENKFACEPETIEENIEFNERSVVYACTSDEFFKQTPYKFDIVFVDGLHHAEQVEKDIVNAWNCLNLGGMIILHDVNPPSEQAQRVPRIQEQWTGDVWRAFVGFRETYPKIKSFYIAEKYGLGLIVKDRKKVKEGFVNQEMGYLYFKANKIELYGL